MKILWVSDPPQATTAYGQQTALFLPRLRMHHEVTLFAGYAGAPYRLTDHTLVLPHAADPYGNDVILGHVDVTHADVVVTLQDPHIFAPDVYKQIPWCAWAPIDCSPVAPITMNALRAARWIWTPSRFGEAQLHKAGLTNVTYIPHGVDRKVFKPEEPVKARQQLSETIQVDLKSKFLVIMNAANKSTPSRKGFYEAFAAFKMFSDNHDDSVLYVHTEASGAYGGENLHMIAELVRLNPEKIIFAPQYPLVCGMLNARFMANMYNAANVFLSASHGEGFGIPSVEAQLCGCPVILPRNSSQTELCLLSSNAPIQTTTYMPSAGNTWERPNIQNICTALTHAHQDHTNRMYKEYDSEAALRTCGILEYDIDTVFAKHMNPALLAMASDGDGARDGARVVDECQDHQAG